MKSNRRVAAISMAFGLFTSLPASATFESLAPFLDEREAIARGQKIGIGSAWLEGPTSVEVYSYAALTVVYRAGRSGIQPGGGIRVAMRHVHRWSRPQLTNPAGDGFVTVEVEDGLPFSATTENRDWFGRHFPWQNMVEVAFPEKGLPPDKTIRVTYGDCRQGSKGIRVQPFDEFPFTFNVYVDQGGVDAFLPLRQNPQIQVVSAEPARLSVTMPSNATLNEPAWCLVRAEDRYGNPAAGYRGVIQFQSPDIEATLPSDYQFKPDDGGVRRFEDIVFNSEGIGSVKAFDLENGWEAAGNPVLVSSEARKQQLYWGDLHGHTLFSDGRGTVEQFYDFAEDVAGLDFCAVTDHAFEIVDWMWEHSKKVTNERNRPGKFVTFQAYEWSGMTQVGGDHNVFFLDPDPPLYRSRSYYDYRNLQMYHGPVPQVNHIEDLFVELSDLIEDKDVFCIPHFGGRPGNAAFHNPKVQRMIEVFSEHRRSHDWMEPFLLNGHRLGMMASTDDHFGNPGYGYLTPTGDWDSQEIGMAAVGVYAEELTRESVFRALYDRHVYATSGDRIILEFSADGRPMGAEVTADESPEFTIKIVGTSPIHSVQIRKDGEIAHRISPGEAAVEQKWKDPNFEPVKPSYYYVRVIQVDGEEAISSPIWVN